MEWVCCIAVALAVFLSVDRSCSVEVERKRFPPGVDSDRKLSTEVELAGLEIAADAVRTKRVAEGRRIPVRLAEEFGTGVELAHKGTVVEGFVDWVAALTAAAAVGETGCNRAAADGDCSRSRALGARWVADSVPEVRFRNRVPEDLHRRCRRCQEFRSPLRRRTWAGVVAGAVTSGVELRCTVVVAVAGSATMVVDTAADSAEVGRDTGDRSQLGVRDNFEDSDAGFLLGEYKFEDLRSTCTEPLAVVRLREEVDTPAEVSGKSVVERGLRAQDGIHCRFGRLRVGHPNPGPGGSSVDDDSSRTARKSIAERPEASYGVRKIREVPADQTDRGVL